MAKRKRRKLTKAQARAEAQRRKRQRQIVWAVVGVVIVAVLVVAVLIAMSGGRSAELVEVQPLRSDLETGVTEEGYPYRGSSDAPVTIVELSDYFCSVCRDFAMSTAELVDDELIATGQVKYVVQPFALWDESQPIVEAAACAREQGGFWDFHHLLFANQSSLSTQQTPLGDLLRQFAEVSGLDVDEFQACLDEGRYETQVRTSTESAKTDLGVNSTPTFFVNGVKTQLLRNEAYIDTLRKAVGTAQGIDSSGQE
jgi:protein-disulfide isomerase